MYDFQLNHGYWPSIRQLAAELGWTSSSSAHAHLVTLEQYGYVERYGPQHRYRPKYTK